MRLSEPTTKTGVLRRSALATVSVAIARHRAVESVNQVEKAAEVAGREVVAHALENVQDLAVGDLAVMVRVGLRVQSRKGLINGHQLLLLVGHFFLWFLHVLSWLWFLLQHTIEENTVP